MILKKEYKNMCIFKIKDYMMQLQKTFDIIIVWDKKKNVEKLFNCEEKMQKLYL